MQYRRLGSMLCLFVVGLLASSSIGADETTNIRVAAISFKPTKLDLAGNTRRLQQAFRDAAAGGAKIAVAPEGVLDGYVINDIIAGSVTEDELGAVALPIDGPGIQQFRCLARSLEMCLAFGFAERIGDDVYNCAIFIDDQGEIAGKYHKMQFAEGYHPSWWWNRLGAESRAFETPYGRGAFMICNDRWNPQLARIPVLDGAQFLMIPAFGSRSQAQDEAVKSRARENGVPVIEANVGVTLIVDAEGEVLAQDRDEVAITFSEIQIPTKRGLDPDARSKVEQEFLDWRKEEMLKRYRQTQEKTRNQKRSSP